MSKIFQYTLNGACLALRPQEVYDKEKKNKQALEDHLMTNHLDSNETKSLKVSCYNLWKGLSILVTHVGEKKLPWPNIKNFRQK